MPQVEGWKCDQCQKVDLTARGYMHYNDYMGQQPPEGWFLLHTRPDQLPYRPLSFCGWACVHNYAAIQTK